MRICVFCGSSPGLSDSYGDAARKLGSLVAEQGHELVYGGGSVGLMGIVADASLDAGGVVTGIMPRALIEREIAHNGLSRLIEVETMHERKAQMADCADGFVTLPGGAGTLEEIFEQWTWAQLGIHEKPCAFLNVEGYYDPLREMISTMVGQGFLKPIYADMLIFEDTPERVLEACHAYHPPPPKWVQPDDPVKP